MLPACYLLQKNPLRGFKSGINVCRRNIFHAYPMAAGGVRNVEMTDAGSKKGSFHLVQKIAVGRSSAFFLRVHRTLSR